MFAIYSIPILGMIFMVQHGQSKMYKARYHENDIYLLVPYGLTFCLKRLSKLMDTIWTIKVV